ncbi:sulfur carrier protein ThiS [Alishewanella longhuensis]|uniref:Sulfur carrier protein ThiS n=1 Tax=Alishewanella longhuensis TaxID=1091037 RepID=A0ABQ3KZL1_9ALTE|nr:sulfur carrier protein ThiS [Alishewanella longhuensis]GHG71476.1 sulfur carrier protein ThiS [Alishewanella longhuensis]
MQIQFNQQPYQLVSPTTLATFLASQQQLRAGIAVAINQQVIPRSRWDIQPLKDGDTIQLFMAIAGG